MREGVPVAHGLAREVLENPALMPSASGNPLLTDIQYEALEHGVARSQSAIISAPTSTGKTLIGLWTIAASILDGVRDDLDSRSSAFISMVAGCKATKLRKEPANYWFDRRHVEQFDVRVQSFRTIDGEVLTLLRVLEPKMIEIYG